MATQALVSPEEYLNTSYPDLDREYVHGVVLERTMPTYLHSRVQALLCFYFELLRRKHPVFVAPELRHAIHPQAIYRIPDVAVFADFEPKEPYPSTPPLVAIEILSPDDRMSEVLQKCTESLTWGVSNIWLIDPEAKKLYHYDQTGLHPSASLSLPQYDFTLTLADLDLQ
jgi:Uma2 family endonuclease